PRCAGIVRTAGVVLIPQVPRPMPVDFRGDLVIHTGRREQVQRVLSLGPLHGLPIGLSRDPEKSTGLGSAGINLAEDAADGGVDCARESASSRRSQQIGGPGDSVSANVGEVTGLRVGSQYGGGAGARSRLWLRLKI